jgi:predicted DNA-binding transcriptional regulator AlpA
MISSPNNTTDGFDRLMTEKEVAKILGLGLSTIQQYRLKGRGPIYCKISRMVRYRASDVQAYIKSLPSYASTSAATEGGES